MHPGIARPGSSYLARPVAVRRRRPVDPVLTVIVTAAMFLAMAVWKPWGDVRPGSSGPSSSASARALTAVDSGASPPAGPGVTGPRPTPLASPLGLDLSFMGASDGHAAWGVAAAYVPRAVVADAADRGRSTITPVVDWVSAALARPSLALPLNHAGSVTVALAVTWPAEVVPTAVELRAIGPAGGADPGRQVVLGDPVSLLLGQPWSSLAHAHDSLAGLPARSSGTFFLPPSPPSFAAAWLDRGWSAGSYEFVVTAADGRSATLHFRIVP